MTKKAFDKIAAGLAEAIDVVRGDKKPARVYPEGAAMTQPENKPEPQDGEDWWVLPKYLGKIVVGRITDGECLTSLGNYREKEIKPIARVLTPDEVAAKDAEIERLTKCLAKANANHEFFERHWYLQGDEITRQRETIAELVAAVNDYQANEVAREKTCGHPWPCACASIRLHAALTKAKEAGK